MSDASQAKRRDCPLLEHAPLIILEIARDGTVLYANRTLSGAPVESVLGQPAHDFLPEGSRALSREMVDRAFRERKSVSYEVRDVFLAGKSFSIRIHVRPIEEDGASVTASVVVENITERAHLQESLGRRLEIEEILVSIAGDLIDVGPERTDEAISEALRRIASFLKAKRIAFFSFSEDGTRFSHTHAWAREGETELDRGPSGIERARFPWMTGKLLANEIVTLGPRESLPPEAAGERAFFERVGIEFAILVPVAKEGRVFGFVGATYDRAVPDPEDHLFVLRAFSFHVAGSLRNKLAAERARRDEVRFRGIFEQALVGIAIARGNPPRLLLANQAAAEMFGLSQEEFAKTIVEDPGRLIHPEDRAAVLARYASRLAGAVIPPHLEFRVVRKNGSTGWIAVFVSNVEYEGESAAQVVFIDSTKRKTAEESLRRSEEKYRLLAESARDYIFVQDREMRIQYLNQACADFFGEKRENLIGRPLADFMPPEMAVEREKNTRLVLESGRSARFQNEIRFHAGTIVLDSILVPILSEAGEVDAVLVVARDITAQRRAEEELRRSEERYRLLTESAQEAIFVLGEDMRFRYANPAFAAMARHDRAYMIGRSMRELMPVEPAIERERNVRTVFEEREPRRFVSRVPLEWKTLVIDTTLVPLPEQPGEGRTVLGITRDITEQSRAEEELKKSEAKYRALAESSGDFIFLVGSDLRVGYVNSIASEY
ncbi:MAG: PAS domain S-box protein, partial [Candidatus Latescibacterota bacterium]